MRKSKNTKLTKKKIRNSKKYDFSSVPQELNQKYCSCLMKVRSKEIPNPYGICNSAVYKSKQVNRDRVIPCTENYNFSKYTLKQLRFYAKEKKIRGYSKLNKTKLLAVLNKYQRKKINKKN